jgi:ring-1,2-phenylacetyl-CoA epoxidase subunit PaaE
MRQLYPLTISKINRLTSDAVEIVFAIPNHLTTTFEFIAGQYITISATINNEVVRRAYSLCSDPTSGEVAVGVKKVYKGKMSTFLTEQVKAGDVLDVMPPKGRFIFEDQKQVVGICAGSGVTPILSMMKTIQNPAKFTLVYGNKTQDDAMFLEEINKMNTSTHFAYSRENIDGCFYSRINDEVLSQLAQESSLLTADAYFICGPGEMIDMTEAFLLENGVDKSKIHFERFTSVKKENPADPKNEDSEIVSDITVIIDGDEFEYTLSSKGESILDSAMEQGADVPFSCKGAVCCTCKAKVMEGKAIMDENYSLSEEEVAEGYILTCQSHPITEKIVVDFDEM